MHALRIAHARSWCGPVPPTSLASALHCLPVLHHFNANMAHRVTVDLRPSSPAGSVRSNRSCSSTSTLDSVSVAYETAPPLCPLLSVREHSLSKRPQTDSLPGWGLVLRGTTSELSEGSKIYCCQIDSIHHGGAAKAAGLSEGDQIVGLNGVPVRDFQHSDVVKMFQSSEELSITVLPSSVKTVPRIRVTQMNVTFLEYLWALMRHLNTLEIINVNIASNNGVDVYGLVSLRCLVINHCSITSLASIKGLQQLSKLEALSLAHNLLDDTALTSDCPLNHLVALKKLDLSHNLLKCVPLVIGKLLWLEVLILVDNSISQLPLFLCKLTRLHTLCLESNFLREVDKVLGSMTSVHKLTLANNALEYEPQVVRENEFVITSVHKNPFSNSVGVITRNEPSLRRTLSVRGQLFHSKKEQRHSLEWDSRRSEHFQFHDVLLPNN